MNFIDDDFLLALELQEQLDRDSWQPSQSVAKPSANLSIVDESWETIDPNPDIRELFLQFNEEFFWGRLAGIEVKWSPRMTLCAGLCVYERRGGLCSVRLSLPLLKLRPRRDLVETLLHEMIHAYLFITDNNKDHDGHGPEFHKHMYRINDATGTKISVYHNFHDEVDHFRQHWWRCNGPCQTRKPYFGYVKRAMNRAPSERDPWWKDHKNMCNGTYVKIKEPEGYGKKKSKDKSENKEKKETNKERKETDLGKAGKKTNPDIRSFLGKGQRLQSEGSQKKMVINGVLTTVDKTGKPSTSKPDNDNHGNKHITSKSVVKDSPKKTVRTSVNAITTSGEISDKELLRQKKFAELMLSDSDDDDLILCDGPEIREKSNESNGKYDNADVKQKNYLNNSTNEKCFDESNYDSNSSANMDHTESIKTKDLMTQVNSKQNNDKSLPKLNSDPISQLTRTSSVDSEVASKVRSVWANKQFGSSLKILDPKADSPSLIPNISLSQVLVNSQNKSQGHSFRNDHYQGHSSENSNYISQSYPSGNGQNKSEKYSSGKRLSGDDMTGSRKKQKIDQESKIDEVFRKINNKQNENCDPSNANCPVCNKSVPSVNINQHLDQCLGMN
ncbi:DNA-dependent metalloprotease SPRTN-like isoform X3 [Mytilus californianus]|uniref:DNA-dependent metalloprotease SPRTN-like isoform X1 n=1 Tax=Mytilus californianus TaxID=6549 RepID=UPI0022484EE0|nr:DNA-dependent metalloprotease SPRTN-like isoform X1 [Mytilus californianus]XP_052106932.1 DNA-dependent metalloprotease SPRTN-like isoform X2 [Mytilus californianus]XP_052106933.1 DNA-dependent metalloprotease SPRTN-like isoform X3 [Mytilus californianus]